MAPAAQRPGFAERLAAPGTALVMLALQVGANATRDALFLSAFPVTTLPWFVALAALASFPAAHGAGWLLGRVGPRRVVPALLGCGCALFAVEAALLRPRPALAAIVLYFHATVLGVIVISTFWSLLDERFDAYTAKRLFARVAGAATLGAVLGGLGAAHVAARYGSPRVLLALFAALTALCVAGAAAVGRGGTRASGRDEPVRVGGGAEGRSHLPYVRVLAAMTALAALVGTLSDYLLKADAAAHLTGGAPLIRFFGLFYAGTGVAAFLLQAAFTPSVLTRLGIPGTLAVHPAAVGAAGLVAVTVRLPWWSVLPRCADATVRHSLFRTGYELLFTPLSDAARRSAKTTIDVGWDCIGNGVGAAVVFLLTRLVPAVDLLAVGIAVVVAAVAELIVVRRLPSRYVNAIVGLLRQQGADLPRMTHYDFSRHTIIDAPLLTQAPDAASADAPSWSKDPLVVAFADLQSDDLRRNRSGLRGARCEPVLVPAAIRLLARHELVDEVAKTLGAHGARVAGQLVDALVDAATPEVVRRRLPLILKSCRSRRAIDGLLEALRDTNFTVRLRCGRALVDLTASDAALVVPREVACAAAERELDAATGEARRIEHVFNLLALAYDRDAMALARRACETGDAHARGTALAYLEATLTRTLFVKLERRLVGDASLQKT